MQFDGKTRAQLEAVNTWARGRVGSGYEKMNTWLKNRRTIESISRVIAERKIQVLWDADDMTEAASILSAAKADVHLAAGKQVSSTIAKALDAPVDFTAVNELALARAKQATVSLAKELTQQQRTLIGEALTIGQREGLNPRETAKLFKSGIGLTEQQRKVVANYRAKLESGDIGALSNKLRDKRSDKLIARTFGEGKPMSSTKVDELVARYEQKFIEYRAEVIGRTEALRATHEGAEDAWNKNVQSGKINPDEVQRTWRSAKDKRTRDSHRSMDGQVRPLGIPFVTGEGVELRYPCDPKAPPGESIQCRCVIVTRLR